MMEPRAAVTKMLSRSIWLGTAAMCMALALSASGFAQTCMAFAAVGPGNGMLDHRVERVFVRNGVLYAATLNGLSISSSLGATWTTYTASSGLPSRQVYDVYVTSSTIYAATGFGLSVSNDGGLSWTTIYQPQPGQYGAKVVLGVYSSGQSIFAATLEDGLAVSNDGGATWTRHTTANGLASNHVRSVYAESGII
jgi:hypothetical protein